VKAPIRLCRTLSNCLCPCLVENNGKHKVAKGILTLDAEGDMYPDDFMPKLYTEEEEDEEFPASKVALPNLSLS
jgi:hypothetical protein